MSKNNSSPLIAFGSIVIPMSGYTKLFQKILDSSIWDEDDKTRIVWITMLAKSDQDGLVQCTINSLARLSRVDLADVEKALAKFTAPDPLSTTEANEGRRIEKVEGGWKLLNHAKYRDMMSLAARREYFRQKKAEYRKRDKELRVGMSAREMIADRVEARKELEEQ